MCRKCCPLQKLSRENQFKAYQRSERSFSRGVCLDRWLSSPVWFSYAFKVLISAQLTSRAMQRAKIKPEDTLFFGLRQLELDLCMVICKPACFIAQAYLECLLSLPALHGLLL